MRTKRHHYRFFGEQGLPEACWAGKTSHPGWSYGNGIARGAVSRAMLVATVIAVDCLVMVGIVMVVTPVPVIPLLVFVQFVIVAVIFVVFAEVAAVGIVFIVIPVVIIAMVSVVDTHAARAAGNSRDKQETRGQNSRTENPGDFEHGGAPLLFAGWSVAVELVFSPFSTNFLPLRRLFRCDCAPELRAAFQ